MKKYFLLLILAALLPMVANADAVEIDGIYYNLIIKGNVAEVTSNPNGYTGNISIPESISWKDVSYTVASIGDEAFRQSPFDNNGIEVISIPQSITSIGYNAFYQCHTLKIVNIGGLESWCRISFANGDSNPANYSHRLYLNGEEIRDFVIPEGILSIGNYAFRGCSGLSSISIPNTVTSIGDDAFLQCTGLASICIPNSVQTIGSQCFWECSNMTSLIIGESVRKIGSSAFYLCKEIISIKIPNSVGSIGVNAFSSCDKLETIEIGNSVYEIGRGAFSYCPQLKDVYCRTERIPTTSNDTFYGSYIEYATLHVLEQLMSDYRNVEPWSNFKNIVGLNGETPEVPKCATPIINYQNGRLFFNSSTDGVEYVSEITDTDIKKHYTNEVQLTATYDISVYATKSGYDNSDVATATLCWIDKEPVIDVTSISQVPAQAVLIQSHDGVLTIQGADDGQQVRVYCINGTEAGTAVSSNGQAQVNTNLPAGSVAIIKIGDRSVKVVIK